MENNCRANHALQLNKDYKKEPLKICVQSNEGRIPNTMF